MSSFHPTPRSPPLAGEGKSCPCGSELDYEACCGRFHSGAQRASTPEELMRSRYTAYARGDIDYVVATHHPDTRDDIDVDGARAWSKSSEWLGLEVLAAEGNTVEFVARYRSEQGIELRHHERSTFDQIDGVWYYRDGDMIKPAPVVNAAPKVGRNEPCPCGSGKKYKKCCGR